MAKKRLAALPLTALLSLSLTIPASADAIWEPENAYYEFHQWWCERSQRTYLANSPAGFVNIRTSPHGRVVHQVENGVSLTSMYLYKNDIYITAWGVGAEGWVSLDDMSLIYDYIFFEEEFADQLSPGTPEAAAIFLSSREGDNLVAWPSPNAKNALWAWSNGGWVYDAVSTGGFEYTYTDPEGHLWGACYLREIGDVWLCLDAPDAGDGHTEIAQSDGSKIPNPKPRVVSVREVPDVTLYPAKEPVPPPFGGLLPAILSAAAVLLSAAALWFFYGKKRNKGGAPCDTPN